MGIVLALSLAGCDGAAASDTAQTKPSATMAAGPEARDGEHSMEVLAARSPLPKRPLLAPDQPYQVVVKFADSARARVEAGALISENGVDLSAAASITSDSGLVWAPLFRMDSTRIEALEERARQRSRRQQPDLRGVFTLEGDTAAAARAATALQELDTIEVVSFEPVGTPPPVDIDPPTPDLTEFQFYRPAKGGLDVDGARELGFDGQGVHICDVEYSWFNEHEAYNDGQVEAEAGQTISPNAANITTPDHGTAVLGILVGGDDGYGITGIAPASTVTLYPELTTQEGNRRAGAILSAASESSPGDVILLEMQNTGLEAPGAGGPAELTESVWLATRMAVDAGMVVVAAAGNGGLPLDGEGFTTYRERGDSGAIIVGAGIPGTREWATFSSYGARVDVQAWGESTFTAGYGDYEEYGADENQRYTSGFGGTSAASAMVAGAAALVQQSAIEELGQPLSSQQMRAIFKTTGLPQPKNSNNIGPLPQVPAAIEAAMIPVDQPPAIELTTPGDTSTPELMLEATIVAEVSGDAGAVQLVINGEVIPNPDFDAPFEFQGVVFPEGTWEVVGIATDIWGNQTVSEPLVLDVGVEPSESTGQDDATDSDGADASTGTSDGLGGGTTGPADATGDTDAGAAEGGGGCSVGPEPSGPWWACMMLLGFGLRTRRRATRRGRPPSTAEG